MAFAKHERFDTFHQITAQVCRAFNHPARIKIIQHLAKSGRTAFFQLAKTIPLANPTISQHLKILRDADLIFASEKVPHTYYEINGESCAQYLQFLKLLVREISGDLSIGTNEID